MSTGMMIMLSLAGAATAAPRPVVIELFTSEGCSDCPPAETLLGEFARDPHYLPLAFHVDYWDSLGWTDRFGLRFADQRQDVYGHALNLQAVYTPQVIIDAHRSVLGSDQRAIESAAKGAREGVPIRISATADTVTVEVAAGAGNGDVLLLAVQGQAVSVIGRGENKGRTLQEYNIVRAAKFLGTWQGEAKQYALPRSFVPPEAGILAVIVQQVGQQQVIGASSIPIGSG
jgi:hypothetical protein